MFKVGDTVRILTPDEYTLIRGVKPAPGSVMSLFGGRLAKITSRGTQITNDEYEKFYCIKLCEELKHPIVFNGFEIKAENYPWPESTLQLVYSAVPYKLISKHEFENILFGDQTCLK